VESVGSLELAAGLRGESQLEQFRESRDQRYTDGPDSRHETTDRWIL